jgi:hypothetical protein
MSKRIAVYAGLLGYLIATWNYGLNFRPFDQDGMVGNLLFYSCLSCLAVDGDSAGVLKFCLLVVAPINAILFAAIEYATIKFLSLVRDGREEFSRIAGDAKSLR